ncbi:InlB B-repeat-containing protein [Paenibacillus sacheonensis]|uniref:SLH domain-containing protein n=1 Tax=Paenibacillus sacheonensis TaxID=742054 RepID=A0A7X4YQL4_9BACL|nr:InlB B-repeat-containing protein [Paenibacillus sacheonensis]MBM7567833.1 putative repeat protein (TIGR02543 family) [Paenibacillus sacheonensis]NBC70723.1 hypothetical protein [Paenibacillus sacheonensis]
MSMRLNKIILALVVLWGIIPAAPMKFAHADAYLTAPQLATGYYHSTVLLSDGSVWAWGRNDRGQLAASSGTYSAKPVQIKGLDRVKQIASSIMSTYALKEDGTLWAWGLNENGQLGDGTLENRAAPVQVKGISGVTAISTGLGYHVLALKNDGTVWAWGRNDNGELGDGTTTQRQLPVQVAGLTNVVALVNAGYHSLALKSDGTVWAWGRNSYGESGGGVSADRTVPYQVAIDGVKAIAAGDHHSMAVKDDGTVWTWGRNTYGTLGDGTAVNRVSPVQAVGIDHVKSVAGGTHFSYALKDDGTVWSWGINNYGQLGDGTTSTRLSPVQVSGLTDVVSLGAGGYNGIAMQSGGAIWAWGYNGYGELGDTTRESRSIPVRNAASVDVTPPAIANPALTAANITETGVTLSWARATDNLSKQAELQYQVYQISSRTAVTVSAVEAGGVRIGTYTADMDTKQVTDLYDGQTYNFTVIVKDKDGRKSIYDKIAVRTLAIPTYAVTYHANGGTGNVPTDDYVYYENEQVTVLGDSGLTKPGYTFAGWNTQADGEGTPYAAGSTFTIGAEDVELYAKWTANPTYGVTYDSNGGTGEAPVDGNAYEQGTQVTVLSGDGLTKPGYTFAGWNTQADGEGTAYAAGAAFSMGATNVELYAKWTTNPTYSVTYDSNSGTGEAPVDGNAYEQGTQVTVLSGDGLTKPGYTFAGWNTQADGEGTAYAAGAAFSMGAANVELYAKWTTNPTYSVTYDSNGGTGEAPVDGNAYEQGAQVTVLSGGGLTKPGYTFAGWNTQADGEGTPYAAGSTFTIGAGDVELYAKWTTNPTYSVRYDSNGGIGEAPVDGNAYEQGAQVTVLSGDGLTKPGYTFAGWNTQADGAGTPYAAGAAFSMGVANVELYAKWTTNPTYSVTYDSNGGTGEAPVDGNAYEQGVQVTVLSGGGLTKPGYTFAGWNTQADGEGTPYAAGAAFSMGAEDVELYAKWTPDSDESPTDGDGEGDGGDDPGDVPTSPPSSGYSLETAMGLQVTVNGERHDLIGTLSMTRSDQRTSMAVSVDAAALQAQLDRTAAKPEVIVAVEQDVDAITVALNGTVVNGLAGKQGTVVVQTRNGSCKLPLDQLLFDSWTAALGEQRPEPSDITVQIGIAKSDTAQLAGLTDAAHKAGVTLSGSPVDFEVTTLYHGNRLEAPAFHAYVEREIPLPDGVSADGLATAALMDPDGTLRHVPTRFVIDRDGKAAAIVNSLTDGVIALIANKVQFADVAAHWAKDEVNDMAARMVTGGVDQRHFDPDAPITRSEFAAILVRALGLPEAAASASFSDVRRGAWYDGAIAAAVAYGLIEGYADGTFRPAGSITREEAIVMIDRTMTLIGLPANVDEAEVKGVLAGFADGAAVRAWSGQAVAAAVKNGLIQGSREELAPERDMTRAETAVIVRRLLLRAGLITD